MRFFGSICLEASYEATNSYVCSTMMSSGGRVLDLNHTIKKLLSGWVLGLFVVGSPVMGWALELTQTANGSSAEVVVAPEANVAKPLELVQTTEVNIQLEQKMPKPEAGGEPAKEETPIAEPVREEPKAEPVKTVILPTNGIDDPFAKDERPLPELSDPLEGYNRFMFKVNDKIYDYFFEPVARTYRDLVHEEIRLAIRNLFNNALTPVKLVSSLVQGDLNKGGRVLSRVAINTTVGVGGLFDVAKRQFGIEDVNEDFDQALGFHGVPTGPYVILPFMGPSHVRNIVGRVFDSFLSPTIFAAPGFAAAAGMNLTDKINSTSFIVDDVKQLDESAIDEYISMRDFYHQYREKLLHE
jgi:phospholipid-binding lipoprotein MlaA